MCSLVSCRASLSLTGCPNMTQCALLPVGDVKSDTLELLSHSRCFSTETQVSCFRSVWASWKRSFSRWMMDSNAASPPRRVGSSDEAASRIVSSCERCVYVTDRLQASSNLSSQSHPSFNICKKKTAISVPVQSSPRSEPVPHHHHHRQHHLCI